VTNVYSGQINTRLHLGPGSIGDVVGTLDLTTCFGNVALGGGTGPLELVFRPTENPNGACNPTAPLQVSLIDAGRMRFTSLSGSQTTSDGTLYRS
jgi:hypothetical protein